MHMLYLMGMVFAIRYLRLCEDIIVILAVVLLNCPTLQYYGHPNAVNLINTLAMLWNIRKQRGNLSYYGMSEISSRVSVINNVK